MTDIGITPPAEAGTGVLDAEAEGLLGAAMAMSQVELEAMHGISDIESWLSQLDQVKTAVSGPAGPVAGALAVDVLDVIGEEVRTGGLLASDAPMALSWTISTHGLKAITPAFVTGGGLASAIALYDATHGHKAAAAKAERVAKAEEHKAPAKAQAKAPVTKAPPLVSPLGGAGPVVTTGTTAGDRLVEAAEARVQPRRMFAPDVAEEVATAISWATGVVYEDTTGVLAATLNDVLARVDTAIRLAGKAGSARPATTKAPKVPAYATETQYANLLKRVERLQGDLQHTTTIVQGLERQPRTTHEAAQPKTGEVVGPHASDLQGQINTVRAVQENHGKAISSIFRKLVPLVPLGTVAPALAQLSPAFVGNLPPTETSLEECCAENLAQTKPIKAYGGAKQLLSDLKGALVKLAELSIVLTFLDTVLTVLDAPVALLGTFRAATWVAPLADRAAAVALADVTWSDQVHAGS